MMESAHLSYTGNTGRLSSAAHRSPSYVRPDPRPDLTISDLSSSNHRKDPPPSREMGSAPNGPRTHSNTLSVRGGSPRFSEPDNMDGLSPRRYQFNDLNTSLPLDLPKNDLHTDRLNRSLEGLRLSGRFENGFADSGRVDTGGLYRGKYAMTNGNGGGVAERNSPLRAKHELRLSGRDDDSGISQTLHPSWRTLSPFQLNGTYTSRNGHDTGADHSPGSSIAGETFSSSVPHSPRGQCSSPARCLGGVPDLQNALHDSEDRRQLLMDKLREAQDTIRQQARKMNQSDHSSKEYTVDIQELKFKVQEYEKKLESLERDRKSCHDQQLDLLCRREDLQKKLETQDHEIHSLKSTQSLLQTDSKRKQETIEQTIKAMNILEEENTKLARAKDVMQKEVSSLKETLDITRSRCDFLEKERKDRSGEIQTLRADNQSLLKKSEEVSDENKRLNLSNIALKEENKSLVSNIQAYNKERKELLERISSLNSTNGEMKANLNAAKADKDRYFSEHVEQKTQIHSFIQDKEGLLKVKRTLEEQLNEVNCDMAKLHHDADRVSEEKRKLEDELSAVKKVSEVLSTELSGTKTKLEKMAEQTQSLEQTKSIAFRQHKLYEQEIASLESQLDNAKKSLEAVKKDRLMDRENQDEAIVKVKEEIRQVKGERNNLEVKVHELESRITHVDHTNKGQVDLHLRELDVWKNNCEKLTSSLGRKDLEMQTLGKRCKELQDQVEMLKVNHDTHQNQYDELVDCRQELIRVQDDNRRLLQERAENQQVIQLLEMQKSILTKTSEDHLTKAHSADRLQQQVEHISRDNNALQDKIKELEKTKDVLFREREINCSLAATMENNGSRMRELEQQVEHLQNMNTMVREQLAATDKENKVLKAKEGDCVTKADFKILEREKHSVLDNYQHLKSQFANLEERYHKLLTDKGTQLQADGNDIAAVQLEKTHLESELGMLHSRLSVTEKSKAETEEQLASLQLEFNDNKNVATQVTGLQKQVSQLQLELKKSQDVQHKQERLIQSLREQSLDDVGADLSQVRAELQQLMNVIQDKDQSIEQLEQQLKSAQLDLKSRDDMIFKLKRNSTMANPSESFNEEESDQSLELQMQIAVLTRERDSAQDEAAETRSTLEDLEHMFDEERHKLQEKLRREINAKDRQIESLEEQLSGSTKFEIRRLKRDPGKLERNSRERCTFSTVITPSTASIHTINPRMSLNRTLPVNSSDVQYFSDDSDSSTETDCVRSGVFQNCNRGPRNNDKSPGVSNALNDSLSSSGSVSVDLSCDQYRWSSEMT